MREQGTTNYVGVASEMVARYARMPVPRAERSKTCIVGQDTDSRISQNLVAFTASQDRIHPSKSRNSCPNPQRSAFLYRTRNQVD